MFKRKISIAILVGAIMDVGILLRDGWDFLAAISLAACIVTLVLELTERK